MEDVEDRYGASKIASSISLYIITCIFPAFVSSSLGTDNTERVLESEMYSLWVRGLDCCDSEVNGKSTEGIWPAT